MSRIAAVQPVLPDHRYSQREITELFAEVCLGPDGAHQLLQRLHARMDQELRAASERRIVTMPAEELSALNP